MLHSLLLQSPINASGSASDAAPPSGNRLAKRSPSPTISPDESRPLKHPAQLQRHAAGSTLSAELECGGGLRLLSLLLQCAESVSVDNLSNALSLLPEISALVSPFGSSPERVASYFSDALRARILSSYLGAYSPLPLKTLIPCHTNRVSRAFHIFNSITPLLKFSHFTSNQAIFEALESLDRVHIVDLDIMQGLQWPGLFHILASRPRPIKSIRITGVGPNADVLEATGRRLSEFASGLGLPFDFTPLEGKIAHLPPIHDRDSGEATVVHWTQHCLYDVTGSDLVAAQFLKSLRPRLVTIVEQDLCHGGDFLGRFVEALHYYSALFDAIGDEGGDAEDRWEVERGVFGGEIRNIVAVGGPKRTGELTVERWGDQLQRAGFRQVSLAGSPAAQANLLLGMVPWKGYTLIEEAGKLKLGWKDLSLLTASAWQPAGVAGQGDHLQWDTCAHLSSPYQKML